MKKTTGCEEKTEGVVVREVDWDVARAVLLAVRRAVFVEEQGVAEALEDDGSDVGYWHFLAEGAGGRAVGTARLNAAGRVGRVAVLASERRSGTGRLLMEAVVEKARREGIRELYLHAQLSSLPFYARLGFKAYGEVFDEAGIAHRAMRRRV